MPQGIKRNWVVDEDISEEFSAWCDRVGLIMGRASQLGLWLVMYLARGTLVDSVGMQFRRLLVEAGLHRPGMGFYSLRHTFRTVADATRDFPAIDLVMGHAAADLAGVTPFAAEMAARYRDLDDERLATRAEFSYWQCNCQGDPHCICQGTDPGRDRPVQCKRHRLIWPQDCLFSRRLQAMGTSVCL